MANTSTLALTVLNISLTCVLAVTIFLSLLALQRIWQEVQNLQYLVTQLKMLAREKQPITSAGSIAQPSPYTKQDGSPIISWPIPAAPVTLSDAIGARQPPGYREGESPRAALRGWEMSRESSPRSFI
ncbi:hypothetical protein LTS10_002841 [Elasticomyces elasticus]|nr:hypothetical protein LTS10_002841 [Elasticomyces elasticus]